MLSKYTAWVYFFTYITAILQVIFSCLLEAILKPHVQFIFTQVQIRSNSNGQIQVDVRLYITCRTCILVQATIYRIATNLTLTRIHHLKSMALTTDNGLLRLYLPECDG